MSNRLEITRADSSNQLICANIELINVFKLHQGFLLGELHWPPSFLLLSSCFSALQKSLLWMGNGWPTSSGTTPLVDFILSELSIKRSVWLRKEASVGAAWLMEEAAAVLPRGSLNLGSCLGVIFHDTSACELNKRGSSPSYLG